jgi:hypothetical protein
MILVTLLFKLGVRFAIFNFIWFFIETIFKMLTGMRSPQLAGLYTQKALKYIFLVGITFAYCLDYAPNEPSYVYDWQKLATGGLILMLYLLGKFQKQQEQFQMFSRFQIPVPSRPYSLRLEITLLFIAALVFIILFFNPSLSENLLVNWFEKNIRSLEKAFLLGFIFQVLGFFFVVGVFMRLLQAFRPKPPKSNGPNQDPDSYTQYEDVSNQHLE